MAFQNFCVRFFQEYTVFKIGEIFHDSVFFTADFKFWSAIFEQFSSKLNPQSTSPGGFILFSIFLLLTEQFV